MNISLNEVQKLRTRGTCRAIKELLNQISINDIELYQKNIFLDLYREILLKSKENNSYLEKNLHNCFINIDRYLKKNKLYKKLAEYLYFLCNSEERNNNLSIVYINLIMQQLTYIVSPGQMIYGFTSYDKPIVKKELYPLMDAIFYEAEKRNITNENYIVKKFNKIDKNIRNINDINNLIRNEQIINNMILIMSGFINNSNLDLIPDFFFLPLSGFKDIRIWKETKFYKNNINNRKYILPKEGILAEYLNAGNIKSILFKELYKDNQIYMAYKLTDINNKSIYGIYDVKLMRFYSIYSGGTGEKRFGTIIENFVLETYSHLICDMEIKNKRISALKIVESLNADFYPNQPIVKFSSIIIKENRKTKCIAFNKEKYRKEIISISPFIRKLPIGNKASKDAINNALKFGYQLQDGETFVRGFKKSLYISK